MTIDSLMDIDGNSNLLRARMNVDDLESRFDRDRIQVDRIEDRIIHEEFENIVHIQNNRSLHESIDVDKLVVREENTEDRMLNQIDEKQVHLDDHSMNE